MKKQLKDFSWLFKAPIAHRGLHCDAIPENSLTAYKAAADKGYSMEIDVRLTRDGKVAVIHDGNLKRVAGVDIKIGDIASDKLKDYPLIGGGTIPLLSELLHAIAGKAGILIELKNNSPVNRALERAVLEEIKDYEGPIALQSFNPLSVKFLRRHSSYACGQLITWRKKGKKSAAMSFMGKLWVTRTSKPHFVAYDILDLGERAVAKWRGKNPDVPFISWTISSEEKLRKAHALGVKNVIFENIIPD